jgi:hypothetical protein
MILVRTDVREEHVASILTVKDSEFSRFAARMYFSTEEADIQLCLHGNR